MAEMIRFVFLKKRKKIVWDLEASVFRIISTQNCVEKGYDNIFFRDHVVGESDVYCAFKRNAMKA